MKKLFLSYPGISRLILGALLTTLALIVSGILPIPIPRFSEYFPFTGVLLIVLATGFMYRTENKNLSALGFDLRPGNLLFLPLGLLLGFAAYFAGFCPVMLMVNGHWRVNPGVNYRSVLQQLYWVLPAAAVQEFLIRGYCYKKLIELSSVTTATVVLGLVFIFTHDFWNGGPMQMITYALTLFIGHLMLSAALLRSGTIYFAIGIHWGNNFATGNILPEGSGARSLFVITNSTNNSNSSWLYLGVFLVANLGFIILTVVIWKWRRSRLRG